ncbi:MAG: FliG C-terminal domain-containing protein [Planctomycetota bacterium]
MPSAPATRPNASPRDAAASPPNAAASRIGNPTRSGLHNRDVNRNALFRRIAIVLSTLPAGASDEILKNFDASLRNRVRLAIAELGEVDPLEKRRAIQAFHQSLQQHDTPGSLGPEEPLPGDASVPATGASAATNADTTSDAKASVEPVAASPLHFLATADRDALSRLLAIESPQTIAIVLADLPPATAADLLGRLPESTRDQTVHRLARLGAIPDEVASELAEHFRVGLARTGDRVSAAPAEGNRNDPASRLRAILAAMPPQTPNPQHGDAIPAPAPKNDARAAETATRVLEELTRPVETAQPSENAPALSISPESRATDDAFGQAEFVRDATAPSQRLSAPVRNALQVDSPEQSGDSEAPRVQTQEAHQLLVALSPKELVQALGRVPNSTAVLALCGLPRASADAALARLTKANAKEVRRQMLTLQSLSLRDIDQAKQRLAQAAVDAAVKPASTRRAA